MAIFFPGTTSTSTTHLQAVASVGKDRGYCTGGVSAGSDESGGGGGDAGARSLMLVLGGEAADRASGLVTMTATEEGLSNSRKRDCGPDMVGLVTSLWTHRRTIRSVA